MSGYVGDIRLGKTIDIKFTTRQASGVPFTLAGTPVISAYLDNNTTQLTAGITLTVDFDGVTGYNNVRVVATGGNGYATATNYDLAITTGTVNSVSVVGESIGAFSIEARSALMPVTVDRTLVVDAQGLADANTVKIGATAAGVAQTGLDLAANYTAARATKLDNLDATVSSRLATAGYTAPLDAAGVRAAIGLATANLDTQIAALPTAAGNAAAVLAAVIETNVTLQNALRAILATATSTSSGFPGAGAKVFKNPAGTKDRVTITTDADGNRTSAPTYDFT